MGMNAIEKILSSHSEQQIVRPGDVVMVEVDVTVHFDGFARVPSYLDWVINTTWRRPIATTDGCSACSSGTARPPCGT